MSNETHDDGIYRPELIEPEVQRQWRDAHAFRAVEDPTREKFW